MMSPSGPRNPLTATHAPGWIVSEPAALPGTRTRCPATTIRPGSVLNTASTGPDTSCRTDTAEATGSGSAGPALMATNWPTRSASRLPGTPSMSTLAWSSSATSSPSTQTLAKPITMPVMPVPPMPRSAVRVAGAPVPPMPAINRSHRSASAADSTLRQRRTAIRPDPTLDRRRHAAPGGGPAVTHTQAARPSNGANRDGEAASWRWRLPSVRRSAGIGFVGPGCVRFLALIAIDVYAEIHPSARQFARQGVAAMLPPFASAARFTSSNARCATSRAICSSSAAAASSSSS